MDLGFFDLAEKLVELNELKNAYVFADEPFDKENFTQLVKESFQAIRQLKNFNWDFKNHASDIKNNLFDFAELLVQLAKYGAELYIGDESEDFIFSASQAVVRLLIGYATTACHVSPTDDTGELYGSNEDCEIYAPSEEAFYSDYWSQNFKYDTNTGDMSEFIELVKRAKE